MQPALGYPRPRDTHPGDQGVIVCDGVGSHLCFTVVEKAIELGIEILLRVPNPSYVLQGEGTLNFKVNTPTIATVVVAIDVVAIAYVVVVADVVGVVVAVAADATVAVVAAGACVVVVVVASTNTNTNAYDVCDSYELKVEWRHQKTRMFTKLNKDRQVHISGHKVLTWEHMMPCFKPAWDKGFCKSAQYDDVWKRDRLE